MDTPRLTGYPIDQAMIQRSLEERQVRRLRRQAAPAQRRWLRWLWG